MKPIILGFWLAVAFWLAFGILLVSLLGFPARAAEPFDWDRYHERQDACAEKDRHRRARKLDNPRQKLDLPAGPVLPSSRLSRVRLEPRWPHALHQASLAGGFDAAA